MNLSLPNGSKFFHALLLTVLIWAVVAVAREEAVSPTSFSSQPTIPGLEGSPGLRSASINEAELDPMDRTIQEVEKASTKAEEGLADFFSVRISELMRSSKASDRQAAAYLNGQSGRLLVPSMILRNLRTFLKDADSKVRMEAVCSMWPGASCSNLGFRGLPVAPDLKVLFNDADPEIRRMARLAYTSLVTPRR